MIRTERALSGKPVVRGYAETRHRAKSWNRRARVARIEATRSGWNKLVVTNMAHSSAEWIYDSLYCARGQAENLIKLHKTQLASDRTSCRSAIANQVRLVLHTAAYWLMLTVRDAIPKMRDLAKAEFSTLRLRLIKVAAPSSKPQAACVSPSPQPAPRPICSAVCPARWRRPDPERRGRRPFGPSLSLQRVTLGPAHRAAKSRSLTLVQTSASETNSTGKTIFMNTNG